MRTRAPLYALAAALALVMAAPSHAQGVPDIFLGEDALGEDAPALDAPVATSSPLALCLANPSDWQNCDVASQSMRESGLESTGGEVLEVGRLDLGRDAGPTYLKASVSKNPTMGPSESANPATAAAAAEREADEARGQASLAVVEADIFFRFDSDLFVSGEEAKVDRFAAALSDPATADFAFLVLGHTDAKGSATYNCRLSAQRAAALTDALTSRGVSSDRLIAIGVGEAIPRNADDPDAPENRRVAFAPLRPTDFAKIVRVQSLCP
ncbi:MAG: OmpA family protein [Devosia sp.]